MNRGIDSVPEGVLDPAAGTNQGFDQIDSRFVPLVKGVTLLAPPGGEADGDMYVVSGVGGSATGAWATHEGEVAKYVAEGTTWQFTPAANVGLIYDRATGGLWAYDFVGAWFPLGGAAQFVTAASHELTARNLNSALYISNTAHTLNIPDNATVPAPIGTRIRIINEHANALAITDDAAVTWRKKNLVTSGIAGATYALMQKTGTDEWMVLEYAALPT
jgi:hypothetical protein